MGVLSRVPRLVGLRSQDRSRRRRDYLHRTEGDLRCAHDGHDDVCGDGGAVTWS